jgi:hypothetical protein
MLGRPDVSNPKPYQVKDRMVLIMSACNRMVTKLMASRNTMHSGDKIKHFMNGNSSRNAKAC